MHATLRPPVADSYFKYVRLFPLRRITSEAENEAALKMLLKVSVAAESDPGALEYYRVLADLVRDFEARTYSFDTSHITAADLVKFRAEERGMSISQLAREVKMTQSNLSEMLSGRRSWSKSAIRKLSAHLNISAEKFLREEKKR